MLACAKVQGVRDLSKVVTEIVNQSLPVVEAVRDSQRVKSYITSQH